MWKLLKLLFSPNGRINQWTYALGLLILAGLIFVTCRTFKFVVIPSIDIHAANPDRAFALKIVSIVLSVVILIWIYRVLTLKRLHDFGKGRSELEAQSLPIFGTVIQTLILLWQPADNFRNPHEDKSLIVWKIRLRSLLGLRTRPRRIGYDRPPRMITRMD